MEKEAATKPKEPGRSRGSKRSVHAAFHAVESTAGSSSGKDVPGPSHPYAPPHHSASSRQKKPERSVPSLRDSTSISTGSGHEKQVPTQSASTSVPIHPSQLPLKKKDRTVLPVQHVTHGPRIHRTKSAVATALENSEAERQTPSWKTWQDAEIESLRKELEELKAKAAEYKRVMKKQNKHVQELTAQLSTATQAKKEQELQYQLLKTKASKQEDLISTIESSLQCQICMDIMSKPQAVSPCGHVFCLTCLQAWFRKAPTVEEEYDPEMDPDYIMSQPKSCPCCRASVTKKPAPLFVIRDISTAIKKAKETPSPSDVMVEIDNNSDDDPWKGIFYPSDDEDSDEIPNLYDPDFMDEYADMPVAGLAEDIDANMLDMFMGHWGVGNSIIDSDLDDHDDEVGETDSEGEDDEGDDNASFDREDIFVPMRWEPPLHLVDEALFLAVPIEVYKLLRRGCTIEMIRKYNMQYTHQEGITAVVQNVRSGDLVIPGRLTMYLGWGVELEPYDENGEAYITELLEEMSEVPQRWLMETSPAGGDSWEARRLMSVAEVDSEYETSDSEAYEDMI